MNFEFSWEINVIKGAGGNASAYATGSSKASIGATGVTPTVTGQVTGLETQVKGDWAGTGSGIWPTVTFAIGSGKLRPRSEYTIGTCRGARAGSWGAAATLPLAGAPPHAPSASATASTDAPRNIRGA